MTTPITPSDIYVIDIGKDKDYNNKVQKITHSLLGNIRTPKSLEESPFSSNDFTLVSSLQLQAFETSLPGFSGCVFLGLPSTVN